MRSLRPTITLKPSVRSAIWWKDHPVIMTDDSVGGHTRMKMHVYEAPQATWIREVGAREERCILVDVGGNVGLFTRQALIASPSITRSFIYEPDEQNFEHLMQNLSPWFDQVSCFNYGLAEEDGERDFYLDPTNCGNLSLLRSAMPPNFSMSRVHMMSAAAESIRWLDTGLPILYKSDTQGFDEMVATLVDPRVWDRTFAAIMEIWRIEKHHSIDAFRDVLSRFRSRRLLGSGRGELTVDEVIQFSSGNDGGWLDLVLEK